ncbi:MAG: arginine--tRNA ligase [Phycisphaerae bacterium]|nr:arginine--tRNA ligase [Phycisphaerae bacterium]
MKSMLGQIQRLFQTALVQSLGEQGHSVDPLIRPAADDRFGDYQSNVAMSLAKQLKQRPRDVAQRLVDLITPLATALCEPFEIAGPGFINIRLRNEWLAGNLNAVPPAEACDRLGIEPADPQTVVVDYSSPNVAKQMHVGHLRSTIIGDTFARMLEFEGHQVIRQNHVGDWGKQFGMLIAYLKEKMPAALDGSSTVHLADLEQFYREANAKAAEDPAFQDKARAEVVALHGGDPATLRAWQYFVDESRNHYMPVYGRLGVKLTAADERGESFYNHRLPDVVADLEREFGAADALPQPRPGVREPHITVIESDGALCIFHWLPSGEPMFKSPEGKPFPFIIRKSDGAYLYATTDLAAVQFRIRDLGADRIIYVTDARQAQHFEMLFSTVRAAGWTRRSGKPEVQLEHASFGSILGEDRKPLKTRSGENIRLSDLLDEAVNRAANLIRANEADPNKKRGFTAAEINDIAQAVGVGAVKYADLSQNRQSDYVFSWDKMLALEGNTAPYLMYAYARIRSIYRKGAESSSNLTGGRITLTEPAERVLARAILRFAETIENAAAGLRINLLTEYLYEVAGLFMKFYESCPVLGAATPEQRASRLRLCDLTARTLAIGLDLLGIRTVERM